MLSVRLRKRMPTQRETAAFALDVNFESEARTTALFGPSGAGKTLILDCLAGFVKPDEGRIEVGGTVLFDTQQRVNLTTQKRNCGYVFQNYALFPHMTVRENMAFATKDVARTESIAERFRLNDLMQRRPHQLSGGQQQRCSIARALLQEPRLLLLDEPARGLDLLLRDELYATLHQVQEQYQIPILLVTHHWGECLALAQQIVLLQEGKVVQTGTPEEIAKSPGSNFLRSLLGASPADLR